MKLRGVVGATLICSLPVWAQPDPIMRLPNGLPFRVVSPEEAENLVSTGPIKLKLEDVSVARALEELQAQSGVELDLQDLQYSKETLAKRISIDVEKRSFKGAFDEIMDKAALYASLRRTGSSGAYRVEFNTKNEVTEGSVFSQGLFSVRLVSLSYEALHKLDVSDAKIPFRTQSQTLTADITMSPDMRLPLVGSSRGRVTRAEDDQGRSLRMDIDQQELGYGTESFYFGSYWQTHGKLKLRPPLPDAKTLRHLEGVVVYSWIVKSETWRVPDLLSAPAWTREFENAEQRFVMSVEVALIKGYPNRVGVNIEVRSDMPETPEEIAPAMLASSAIMDGFAMQDGEGRALRRNGGFASKGYRDGKIQIAATFDGTGNKTLITPLQMIFKAPLDVVQTEAPFAFENVPLP